MTQPTSMTMTRLEAILDAYGADPERWPADERDAVETLVAASQEARALLRAAADLDEILDAAPSHAVRPKLADDIVAALPSKQKPSLRLAASRPAPKRTRLSWRWATQIVPMAAAAALVLWLSVSERSDWSDRSDSSDLAALDNYVTPTDALLEAPSAGAIDSVPGFGCTDAGLGCIDADDTEQHSALDMERYS